VNAWKPILAALVIFAAGVVTGGLTVTLRQPQQKGSKNSQVRIKQPALMPREGQLRELSRRMQSELELRPEQWERIETIIRESQERMKKLREEVGQKITEEFRGMRQKIRGELTPEQRKKFVDIMRQHDERNKRDDSSNRTSPSAAGKPE
jgi:Spy/CpxP family protein refolding chaperone